tara:strand:+ start:134 stop:553 length:420 start_codon:yes stop_codon:yes gene_type:complete
MYTLCEKTLECLMKVFYHLGILDKSNVGLTLKELKMLKNDNIVYVVYSRGKHKAKFFSQDDVVSFVSDKQFYLRGVFKDHDEAIKEAKRMTKWDPFAEDEEESYRIVKETDYFIEMSNDYYKDDEEYSERIFVLAEEIQ